MKYGRPIILAAAALALVSCQDPAKDPDDADVIVVGAGIAGLAAALEAESHGARVLVMEANSVAGGHAVKAGGFALVDTPLQRAKGYKDSPDIAYRDLMAWGEDADPWWVRFYVDNVRAQVHDWLQSMGVRFVVALDTPEHSVPRFHFTAGSAVNAVVPMIRQALNRQRIEFLWNTEVTELLRRDGVVNGVRTAGTRNADERIYRARAVIVTTGGFESNLEMVRQSWRKDLPAPARLLAGAGAYATGSGLRLAEPLGAAITRLDHQEIFVSGLPDPRDPAGTHGVAMQNTAAIWVDATGRRFTNEDAASKVTDTAVLKRTPATHWLVFDAEGEKHVTIRGSAWMSAKNVQREIMDNPALVKKADSIAALAKAAGLPADALADTVLRFNRFLEQGMDTDFGRIAPGMTAATPLPIERPPFYAVQLFPMSRKSMGGLAIDHNAQVLGGAGQLIRGLFAAGEVTGVAGINGSFGGEGTFLAPSVLIGRVAGRSAVALALGEEALQEIKTADSGVDGTQSPPETQPGTGPPQSTVIDLSALLRQQRKGYWHFNVAHALVVEREDACASCHEGAWQPGPAETRQQRVIQLQACTRCH